MNGEGNGLVRAEGRRLVDGSGREILLRGVGFGSWMLPEGYMWRFPGAGDRPRRIEAMIRRLIGAEKAERFWELYYDRYVGEADIRRIAEEGFNSVRVPIHWRVLMDDREPYGWKEEGWRLLDRMIDWCREYRIYVILDLHGAPGGQTGTNIDDSERDLPELFREERYRRLTVELWRRLAERYRDEWIVAGYDLLNEPLPDWFAEFNPFVMPLYRDIIRAIREVDSRHMIILEGAHWATDWSIFGDGKPDDNLMLQFHKYWNNPDTESIRKFLDKRDEWDVPIYMGEGGENNADWYAGAFRLYEDHGISWNFWTWKKMDTDNSPCSVRRPEGWERLVSFLEGGETPAAEDAERILWAYLDNLAIERCDYRSEVVNALFRRPNVRIPAAFYGFRGEGVSYGFGGVRRGKPAPIGFRNGDGTDIRFVSGGRTEPNFQHGGGEPWADDEWLLVHLEEGDWLAYEFELREPSPISLELRLAAPDGTGRLTVTVDGVPFGVDVAAAPGTLWQTVALSGSGLHDSGIHRIKVIAAGGPVRLQWLTVHKR